MKEIKDKHIEYIIEKISDYNNMNNGGWSRGVYGDGDGGFQRFPLLRR
jgi:hypothetical protein